MWRAFLVGVPLCCAQHQLIGEDDNAIHNQIPFGADEHALLQARVKLRSPQNQKAVVLLENVQDLALNIKSQSPETVTALVAAMTASIQGMKPLLHTEHTAAQSQLDAQFAEIGACSANATHGTDAVEDAVDDLAAQLQDVVACAADQTAAAAARDAACDVWKHHAESTYSAFPLSLSGSPDPNDILSKLQAWENFAEDQLPEMISKKAACTAATDHYTAEESRCLAVKSLHDEAFCDHQAKCTLLNGCHKHEVRVYDSLNASSVTAVTARQSHFRTLTQVECLLGLITTAVEGNSTVAPEDMNSCDKTANVDDFVLSVPTPQSLSPCPTRKRDDPKCPAVHMPPLWSEFAAPDLELNFTTCGAIGGQGPSKTQCTGVYAGTEASSVEVTQGYQVFTAPFSARVTIEAHGARGGNNAARLGGYGATTTAQATVNAGERIVIVVGQKGWDNPNNADWGGGGGGATWVAKEVSSGGDSIVQLGLQVELLTVAGGGSGQNDNSQCHSDHNEQTEGGRGIGGNPDQASVGGSSGGGGGYKRDGSGGARAFLNGATGDVTYGQASHCGGFGGGGRPYNGGGGGGGYQGGDCNIGSTDCRCHGGTSFGDSAVSNNHNGDGSARISFTRTGSHYEPEPAAPQSNTQDVPRDGLVAWYTIDGFDANSATWSDESGNGHHATVSSGQLNLVQEESGPALHGTTSTRVDFGQVIKPTFTIASVTRYLPGRHGRILQGSGANWLHGHWGNHNCVSYYSGWKTFNNAASNEAWQVMIGQNSGPNGGIMMCNGNRVEQYGHSGSGNVGLHIHGGTYAGEVSDFGIREVITWNRALDEAEINAVNDYLR